MRSAAVLLVCLGACRGARSNVLAECDAAELRLRADDSLARWTAETCARAFSKTGSPEARFAQVRALLVAGDLDAVVSIATESQNSPRLWHLAGDAELERGRAIEARRWYDRALEHQRVSDPKRGANTAARLAEIAASANAIDEAIHRLYEGLELAVMSGDTMTRVLLALGLANLLLEIGDVPAGRSALKTVESMVPPESPFFNDYLLVMGELDAFAGRTEAAAASFDRCIRVTPAAVNPRTQLRCHIGRAALSLNGKPSLSDAHGDLDAAERYLVATEQMFGPDPNRGAELAWMRALLASRGGAPAEADALLGSVPIEDLGSAMQSRIRLLQGERLAAEGRLAEAERSFLEASTAVERLRDGGLHRETRRSLPRELRAPYEAIFLLRLRQDDRGGAIDAMEYALTRDFTDRLAAGIGLLPENGTSGPSLRERVAEAERRVRVLRKFQETPPRFDRSHVAGVVIAFFTAQGILHRVRITRDAIDIHRIADSERLGPLIAALRSNPDDPSSSQLRQLLLPDAALPPPGDPLVVVPDQVLAEIRFSALRRPDGYLVERNPIVLAPTLVIATRASASEPNGPAVVVGDPDGTLPHALIEATDVAELLGVTAHLGAEATRQTLIDARRANVLHVASHGRTRADDTTIVLADGEVGSADVLELGLAPSLAVVASCTSAATTAGGQWTSISGALLASGARSVIGTLGSIPDGSSHDLLLLFYRELAFNGPAVALARAQQTSIRRGVPVAVWSSFAAFGHETTRTTRRN